MRKETLCRAKRLVIQETLPALDIVTKMSRVYTMINENKPLFRNNLAPIKEIRLALKLTQEQFAVTIGVTSTTIGAWENGRNEPSFTALQIKQFLTLIEPLGLTYKDLPDKLGKPPDS